MYSKVFLGLLIAVCVSVVAATNKVVLGLTTKQVLEITEVSNECAKKAGINPEILSKVLTWTIEQDDSTKPYIYCLAVNGGFVDADGNSSHTKGLEYKVIEGSQQDYVDGIKECAKIYAEDKVERVVAVGNCFFSFITAKVL